MQPTLNIGPLSAQASDVDDTALQCLLIVAALHDLCADEAQLRREFGSAPQTLQSLRLAAARIGFTSKVIAQNPARWSQAPLPAIAIQRDGSYCVVAQFQEEPVPKLLIHRPGSAPRILTLSEFDMSWSGQLIYLSASSK